MLTEAAAAVPVRELGEVVSSLADRSFEITGALDVLISGVWGSLLLPSGQLARCRNPSFRPLRWLSNDAEASPEP